MAKASDDAGTIQAMLDRLNNWRLPRAQAVKKKVDGGATLDANDMQFLKQVMEDAQSAQALAERNPEFKRLVAQMLGLYNDITKKALENEQQKR
jgi:hypothetical protein